MKKYTIKAVAPPPLQNQYGVFFGYAVAVIAVFFTVLHLFRIDTLVPIIDFVIPGGQIAASLLVIAIMIAEIFGIPFALRMKLSPLAQVVSGALSACAPLAWLLITIWGYGSTVSTGQFGQFAATPSGLMSIILNAAWLVFVFAALWTLGYGHFTMPSRKKLRK